MTDSDKRAPNGRADDLTNRQLGDFHLLRRLGAGAMADVYLAEQQLLKRRVAVKVLKAELSDDPTYLARFEREAQAAASLVHANIVQIYEVGHLDNHHYIAQEYIEGQNLAQWLLRKGPLDLPRALSVMRQVCAALAKAADHDVVHRDIKPENILITHSGEVKVADFGLARVANRHEATDLTQVGVTMGTPLYMSPEQVEGQPLDGRSDIYSFGVTCYHMLAGVPPFVGETALGVAVQHLKRDAEPLENVRPDLPPALCRVVHQMLAKDVEKRWQSARELLRELRRIHAQYADESWPEELAVWETTGLETIDDPRLKVTARLDALMKTVAMNRPVRRRHRGLVAAAVAMFVAGGLLGWWTLREPPLLAAAGGAAGAAPPRFDSALKQYYYASQTNTIEAWQSVIDNFPNNQYMVRRAEEKLAQMYLQDQQYAPALELFEKFIREGKNDDELQAFGLAGKCATLTLQGKYRESDDLMSRLWSIRDKLRNSDMQKLVGEVVARNGKELGSGGSQKWDDWLNEQFGSDAQQPQQPADANGSAETPGGSS